MRGAAAVSGLIRRAQHLRFDIAARGILSTPPLRMREAPLTIVSMVCRRDLCMYLAGVKSLYTAIGEGAVAAVDDGTLTPADHEVLRRHVPGIRIEAAAAIDTGRCPRGGTWERLVLIADYCRSRFVIQMDCDTLTRRAIPDVVACYRAGISFGLGTSSGKRLAPVAECAAWARSVSSADVSVLAERELDKLPGAGALKYFRGSSGFAGFAMGSCSRAGLECFSGQMRELLGSRWDQWGSEQVTSNFTIANAPDARVLPHPDYCCFYPELPIDYTQSRFLHFIGGSRYQRGLYAAEIKRLVRRLPAQPWS